MKIFAISMAVFALGLAACQAPQNSVSQDPAVFGNPAGDGSERNVVGNAQAALARNCVQCHSNFSRWSESDFRTKFTSDGRNWIVAGDLVSSALYQKLRGVSSSGNMPPSGPISTADRTAISAWIMGMKAIPAPTETPGPVLIPAPAPTQTPVPQPTPTAPPVLTPAEQRYKNMFTVVKNRCAVCHDEFVDTSEAEFLKSYFVAGSPEKSMLFQKLRGVSPDGDMPPIPRPELTADEIEAFRAWIMGGAPTAR